jgi:hypothetical protein
MTAATPLTAAEKRAMHPLFRSTFSLAALRAKLPLRFPVPEHTPPSPKQEYRSHYRYLGAADLADLQTLRQLTPFEITLRLIDFSPLRDLLAKDYYRPSQRGQRPFDPVSLFLALCLRREQDLSWRALQKLLAAEHGAGWRRLFGFDEGVTPSEAGLRYFCHTIGDQLFAELCPLFADLLHQAALLPEHSTFPGDSPERGVTLSHDLMLHPARSRMKCAYVTARCYDPAPRPCPAQEAGQEGCDCTSPSCAHRCRLTTPLDQEARYIHYQGGHKNADLPDSKERPGRHLYGYASTADRLLDDRFACAWTLRSSLYPANQDERSLFPATFASLRSRLPWLQIGEVLADAALGFQECLDPIWQAGALRMVDIRAAPTDQDTEIKRQRGYDERGYPLCSLGYIMSPNGYDYQRRRHKWRCAHACRKDLAHPPPLCPYLSTKHGQVLNVGRTLPDGSVRLAREVPYASSTWKKRYARRNSSESRNGGQEGMNLKRLPGFGLMHGLREVLLGDFLQNLRTLGRLVGEATLLALLSPPRGG